MRHQAVRSLLWQAVIVFALCYFPVAALAQTAAGTITGTVRAADTQALLQNLAVGLYHADDASTRVKVARTDTAGVFTFTGLAAGNYKIRFYTTGINYIEGWYKSNTSPPASAVAAFNDSDSITLTAASGAALQETQLALGLTITGYLADSSPPNNPIGGVYVQAYSNGVWAKTSDTVSSATDGSYVISGLKAGNYTIRFWAYQTIYTTEWYSTSGTTHTVPDAGTATAVAAGSNNVNAQLSTGGSISGTVYIGTTPLAGALVAVYDSTVLRGFTTTSNAVGSEGTYIVRGLPLSGSYVVRFYEKVVNNTGTGLTEWYNDASSQDGAAPLTFPLGITSISGIDASLDRGPISGKVTNSTGSPVAGVSVKVYASSAQTLQTSATTDANGQYVTAELPAGNYKVQFSPLSWYNNKTSFAEADLVPAGALVNGVFKPVPLGPVYNLLIMKKRCVDAANQPTHCNCVNADGAPAYCSSN